MPDGADEIVVSIGRELVSRLAPEELPLYPSQVRQFQGAPSGRQGRAPSGDEFLGFGAAEAMTMLTPVILAFTTSFWQALVAEAAHSSLHGVLDYIKAHILGRHEGAAESKLTPGQLQLVRAAAEREADRLDIPEAEAGLLADAIIGFLTAPAVS